MPLIPSVCFSIVKSDSLLISLTSRLIFSIPFLTSLFLFILGLYLFFIFNFKALISLSIFGISETFFNLLLIDCASLLNPLVSIELSSFLNSLNRLIPIPNVSKSSRLIEELSLGLFLTTLFLFSLLIFAFLRKELLFKLSENFATKDFLPGINLFNSLVNPPIFFILRYVKIYLYIFLFS